MRRALTIITAAIILIPAIQAAEAAKRECLFRRATIVGTQERDRLRGTPGPDVIVGLGGRDVILGKGGRDFLCGGHGRDRLLGGRGPDTLNGDNFVRPGANDLLRGGEGADTFFSDPGDDTLRGGPGASDQLNGGGNRVDLRKGMSRGLGTETDSLRGIEDVHLTGEGWAAGNRKPNELSVIDTNNVTLIGRGGNDTLWSAQNDGNVLRGSKGNDLLFPHLFGTATMDGGQGIDTLDLSGGSFCCIQQIEVDLTDPWFISIESIVGSKFADTLWGNDAANTIQGGGRDDSLFGRDGDDSLDGGRGNNTNDGGVGTDRCINPDTAGGAVDCEAP